MKIEDGLMLQQKDADAMLEYLNKLPVQGRLLEIGTGYGHSAKFFSKAKPHWYIYTVDSFGLHGDGRIYKRFSHEEIIAVENYINDEAIKTNVIQILAHSNNVAWELQVDVLYLDGGHTYECVKADFDNFAIHVKANGYIFLHDFHREDFGVKQLVHELTNSGKWELLFSWKVAIIKRK